MNSERYKQPIANLEAALLNLHPNTGVLVVRFAAALAEKLAAAEAKYNYSDDWANDDWQEICRDHLQEHITKGDPRDVAAYCAFMWHHGWSTNRPPTSDGTSV
jgi:hypothetical protein